MVYKNELLGQFHNTVGWFPDYGFLKKQQLQNTNDRKCTSFFTTAPKYVAFTRVKTPASGGSLFSFQKDISQSTIQSPLA